MNPNELLFDEGRALIQQKIEEALRGENLSSSSVEIRVKAKNGQTYWGLITAKVTLKLGKPDTVLIFAQDITERKKAEQSLRQSEQLYRTLFDNTEDGFALIEPLFSSSGKVCDLRLLAVNKVYEKISGDIAKDLVGRLASDYAPKLNNEIIETAGEVVNSGEPKHIEVFESYTQKWYDCFYFVYDMNQAGVLFRDITERKNAEEALKESQTKYQALIETTSDFIWEMDVNGRYTYCSPQMEKLWGLNPLEMIGKSPFDQMPEDARAEIYQTFVTMARDPKPLLLEVPAFDGQKNLIFLEVRGVPFFDKDGNLRGYRGISRDVTERWKAEKQLQDQERLAAIGATAGMIGHDIRNPLQAIIGELFLAKVTMDQAPESEGKKEALESIEFVQSQIDYINKIVSDLQDYSRPLKPEFASAELTQEIKRTIDTITIPQGIKLSFMGTDIMYFRTDVTYIRRILTNLISNAIQAMPEGGNLTVLTNKTSNKISIVIQDTGVGIPEEIKLKLFTPLVTTKSKGQGLGLAVVKRLVDALNGSIAVDSRVGEGTKFVVALPLC